MSNSYKLEGVIKELSDVQTFDSGFCKREFVVTTQDEKYPQDIKLELLKDDVQKIERFSVGDIIEVGQT